MGAPREWAITMERTRLSAQVGVALYQVRGREIRRPFRTVPPIRHP